ncbi:MAG: polysaccharide deacetylase family protein, partial [Microthrixaceae bacterium]
MLGTAGVAALGGAAAASAAFQVVPNFFDPPVERDEIGRHDHRRDRPGPCELRWCAQTDHRALALTFDDGPDPDITPQVLATLARHEVTATFFVVGRLAEANRGLLERIVDAGHEVGNHSWAHLSAVGLDKEGTDIEVARAQESLESMTGVAPRWYRPPRGQVTGAVMSAAARNGLDVALWTQRFGIDPPEERPNVEPLLAAAEPGDFVLVHDGVVESVDKPDSEGAVVKRRRRLKVASSLDELLNRWVAGGWSFDTVSAIVDSEAETGTVS